MLELGRCARERTWAPEAREAKVWGSGTPEAGQEQDSRDPRAGWVAMLPWG